MGPCSETFNEGEHFDLERLVREKELPTTFLGNATVRHEFPASQRTQIWRRTVMLGKGGSGSVFLDHGVKGSDSQGKLRAVKQLSKPAEQPVLSKASFQELTAVILFSTSKVREILLCSGMTSFRLIALTSDQYRSYFVQCLGWYEDTESLYITMEYLSLGDLQTYLVDRGPVPPSEARYVARQVVLGIDFSQSTPVDPNQPHASRNSRQEDVNG
jgi:serine/threonine protein kinase